MFFNQSDFDRNTGFIPHDHVEYGVFDVLDKVLHVTSIAKHGSIDNITNVVHVKRIIYLEEL